MSSKAPQEGKEYPHIRQTLNTCGLASMGMIFLYHSPEIEDFLIRMYKSKYMYNSRKKAPVERHNEAIIWSQGYLLLKTARSRKLGNWVSRLASEYDYMDFKIGIDLFLDGKVTKRIQAKYPDLSTIIKYFRSGIIRKRFMRYYLDQFKTQIELRILALMLGFSYKPYPGDVMGNLYFMKGEQGVEEKLSFLEDIFNDEKSSALLGHGQSHWMVPHAINYGDKNKAPTIAINDPMGSKPRIPVNRLDNSYIFYFFEYSPRRCKDNLSFLENVFHL
ncbi:hypothetical protein GF325_10330 [Candidatus Bathyarchaeota archaeon]|nr:hypothetical protein [Candidatus Bathyarchaeota archaeon]